MTHWLCNQLLACALRALGVDITRHKLNSVRPLADGGMIVVLDAIQQQENKP